MKKVLIFLLAPPAIALFVFVCGEVVMHLWNWLVPTLFGWRQITFWQGLGLMLLCRILFGSWGGSDHSKYRRSKAGRWGSMTLEEREKFRESMRSRCSGFDGATTGSKEPA
jgi:hypothetical protein